MHLAHHRLLGSLCHCTNAICIISLQNQNDQEHTQSCLERDVRNPPAFSVDLLDRTEFKVFLDGEILISVWDWDVIGSDVRIIEFQDTSTYFQDFLGVLSVPLSEVIEGKYSEAQWTRFTRETTKKSKKSLPGELLLSIRWTSLEAENTPVVLPRLPPIALPRRQQTSHKLIVEDANHPARAASLPIQPQRGKARPTSPSSSDTVSDVTMGSPSPSPSVKHRKSHQRHRSDRDHSDPPSPSSRKKSSNSRRSHQRAVTETASLLSSPVSNEVRRDSSTTKVPNLRASMPPGGLKLNLATVPPKSAEPAAAVSPKSPQVTGTTNCGLFLI